VNELKRGLKHQNSALAHTRAQTSVFTPNQEDKELKEDEDEKEKEKLKEQQRKKDIIFEQDRLKELERLRDKQKQFEKLFYDPIYSGLDEINDLLFLYNDTHTTQTEWQREKDKEKDKEKGQYNEKYELCINEMEQDINKEFDENKERNKVKEREKSKEKELDKLLKDRIKSKEKLSARIRVKSSKKEGIRLIDWGCVLVGDRDVDRRLWRMSHVYKHRGMIGVDEVVSKHISDYKVALRKGDFAQVIEADTKMLFIFMARSVAERCPLLHDEDFIDILTAAIERGEIERDKVIGQTTHTPREQEQKKASNYENSILSYKFQGSLQIQDSLSQVYDTSYDDYKQHKNNTNIYLNSQHIANLFFRKTKAQIDPILH
ncbi:MAG: hypothetical protein EZS28_045475, partial [Streblomastix strix]